MSVINLVPNYLRIVTDKATNSYRLEFYNSTTATWEVVLEIDPSAKIVKVHPTFSDDLKLNFGTDRDFSIRYDSSVDAIILRDETNGVDIFKLEKNKPVVIDIPVPVIFETPRTGLPADSTGVKFTSAPIIPPIANYLSVAIEATWTASANDSVTAIELYDETAGKVVASVSGNTGTDVKSDYVKITPGNSLVVRVNVTTASATSGATTDVLKAIVYFRITLS